MELTIVLIIFALGLLVVASAFCSGVNFVFKVIGHIFKSIFGGKEE